MKISIFVFVLLVLFITVGARYGSPRDEIVRNVDYEAARIISGSFRKLYFGYKSYYIDVKILGEEPHDSVQASLDVLPLSQNESFTDYCLEIESSANVSAPVMYQSLRVIVVSSDLYYSQDPNAYCGHISVNPDGGATTFGPNCEVIPPQSMSWPTGNISSYWADYIARDFWYQYHISASPYQLGDSPAHLASASFDRVPLLENESFTKYALVIWGNYTTIFPPIYKHMRVLYGDHDNGPVLCPRTEYCRPGWPAGYGPRCEKICPVPVYIPYDEALKIEAEFVAEYGSCMDGHRVLPMANAPRNSLLFTMYQIPYSSKENLWGYCLVIDSWLISCDRGPLAYKNMRVVYEMYEGIPKGGPFCGELPCNGTDYFAPNNFTDLGWGVSCSNMCPPPPPQPFVSYSEKERTIYISVFVSTLVISFIVLCTCARRKTKKTIVIPDNGTQIATKISLTPQQVMPQYHYPSMPFHQYSPVPQFYTSPYPSPSPQFYPPFPTPYPSPYPHFETFTQGKVIF